MYRVSKRTNAACLLVLVALLFSVALPLQILLAGPPISHPDPERFAELHSHGGFWWRATLTFIYFPGVILLHLLLQPASHRSRMVFIAGFSLFLLGNGIDFLFRSVQFLVAHGLWAPQMLDVTDAAARDGARAKILAFNEIAPAVGFCFSLLFAVGRGLMGAALLFENEKLQRLTGVALMATGVLNMIFALAAVLEFSFFSAAGPFYLWIWPIGLVLAGMTAWRQLTMAARRSSVTS